MNKVQQNVQSKNDDDKRKIGSILSSKKENTLIGWSGLNCSFVQVVNMKELILLDIDSMDTFLCDPKYI